MPTAGVASMHHIMVILGKVGSTRPISELVHSTWAMLFLVLIPLHRVKVTFHRSKCSYIPLEDLHTFEINFLEVPGCVYSVDCNNKSATNRNRFTTEMPHNMFNLFF